MADAEDPFPIGMEVVFTDGADSAVGTVVGRPAPGQDPGPNPRTLPRFGVILSVPSAEARTALVAMLSNPVVWVGPRGFEVLHPPSEHFGPGPVRDIGVTLVEVWGLSPD